MKNIGANLERRDAQTNSRKQQNSPSFNPGKIKLPTPPRPHNQTPNFSLLPPNFSLFTPPFSFLTSNFPFSLLVFLFSIFLSGALFAEEAAGAEGLPLERVREMALANSRSLARYDLAVRNSVLDGRTQEFSNLPSLSLGGNASVSLWDAGGNSADIGDTFGAGMNVGVSQSLFNGGKSLIYRRISALNTESARKDALAEYFRVLDAADTAYYGVLEAAANVEAAESSLRTAELSLSMAELRLQNRMIREGEYLEALAEKESKETSRNQARRDLTLGRAQLQNITGLGELPALAGVAFDRYNGLIQSLAVLNDGDAAALYAVLWKQAASHNPGLSKSALASQSAEQNLSLSKRDYAPSLGASFSTGLNYSPQGGLEFSSGRVSISGSIPLDLWVTAANVEKRRIARDQAELVYLDAENTLRLDVQSALLDAVSQAGLVLSARRACEYAEKHFEYTMELYRLSQNSVSDLSAASALVSGNRGQLIRAQYGFLRVLSTLRSLGGFDSETALEVILSGPAGEG
jgi:outer membrane protein TolC